MKRIDWTRRDFLKTAGMMAGAGYLSPVLKLIEAGKTIEGAYPEEVLHIEAYTKGRVKPGMIISKENAELVKDLVAETQYLELQRGNLVMKIGETTLGVTPDQGGTYPSYWLAATLRNKGAARLDEKGQLWTRDGKPWTGGMPFPEATTGLQHIWNFTCNPVKSDYHRLASVHTYIDTNGTKVRNDYWYFDVFQLTGRTVLEPKPVYPGYESELYRAHLCFVYPEDIEGLQELSVVYYDGAKLPDTYIYVPSLRRVRRVPSTQRYEPHAPYALTFASDSMLHNDPTLTWSWKYVGSKPMLFFSPRNTGEWGSKEDFTGTLTDAKLPRLTWELRPEMVILDGVSHLPGGDIYSRKRLYMDSVWAAWPQLAEMWDHAGRLWKYLTGVQAPLGKYMSGTGYPDGAGGIMPGFTSAAATDLLTDFHYNQWMLPRNQWAEAAFNIPVAMADRMTPTALIKWSWK